MKKKPPGVEEMEAWAEAQPSPAERDPRARKELEDGHKAGALATGRLRRKGAHVMAAYGGDDPEWRRSLREALAGIYRKASVDPHLRQDEADVAEGLLEAADWVRSALEGHRGALDAKQLREEQRALLNALADARRRLAGMSLPLRNAIAGEVESGVDTLDALAEMVTRARIRSTDGPRQGPPAVRAKVAEELAVRVLRILAQAGVAPAGQETGTPVLALATIWNEPGGWAGGPPKPRSPRAWRRTIEAAKANAQIPLPSP